MLNSRSANTRPPHASASCPCTLNKPPLADRTTKVYLKSSATPKKARATQKQSHRHNAQPGFALVQPLPALTPRHPSAVCQRHELIYPGQPADRKLASAFRARSAFRLRMKVSTALGCSFLGIKPHKSSRTNQSFIPKNRADLFFSIEIPQLK